ncbi:hypothetical protein SEA_LOOPER_82 [Gordonia phage Looper]|nr:hypothetical protein SEA_LOOPER_82 [Gordonia phage Looper]
MPLSHLLPSSMPGLEVLDLPSVLVHKQHWLFAQSCTVESCSQDSVEILLVYRSPLVKDTGKLYAPVADRILRAEAKTSLFHGVLEAEKMMHGKAEAAVYLLSKAVDRCLFDLEVLRNHITDAITHRNGDLVP